MRERAGGGQKQDLEDAPETRAGSASASSAGQPVASFLTTI